MDTLLNFSGGIDSTWCLYHYLKRHPDKTLLVHHCTLRNWEGRADVEWQAVQDIRQYLSNEGLTNYKFLHTTFDYGDISHVVKDKEVIGFFTGVILRDPEYKSVHRVIISSNKEDVSRRKYYRRTEKNRKAIIDATARCEVEYVYPMTGKPRTQLMETLPDKLLELTWYCRKPDDGDPCGSCKTCKQVKKAKAEIDDR